MDAADITKMDARECKRELEAEQDLNLLRALIAFKRSIRMMKAKASTGKVETDVQEGIVRGVRPTYTERVS